MIGTKLAIPEILLNIQDFSSTRLHTQGMIYPLRCLTQSLENSNLTHIFHYFLWNKAHWRHLCTAISNTPPSHSNHTRKQVFTHTAGWHLSKLVRRWRCNMQSNFSWTKAQNHVIFTGALEHSWEWCTDGNKQSQPKPGTVLPLVWRGWGKWRKTSVGTDGVPAQIWTQHFPNTSLELEYYSDPFDV
jgi:hypothetical protein